MTDHVGHELAEAYASAAPAWAGAPTEIYRRFAEELVVCSPVPFHGRRTADLGAGTGAVSQVLAEAGAEVVAFDLVAEMLAQHRTGRPPSAVAELTALPLAGDSVDAVVAGFVLNHLQRPARALAEMARVTRTGGPVLTTTFAADARHPAKVVVDEVARSFGYVEPDWYRAMKREAEPLTARPEAIRVLAGEAGLVDVHVAERAVDIGVDTPEAMAAYRLSMAHLAPFVAGLDDTRRGALHLAVIDALGHDLEPIRPVVLFLVATAP